MKSSFAHDAVRSGFVALAAVGGMAIGNVKRAGLLHASGPDACSNPVRFLIRRRSRPQERQNTRQLSRRDTPNGAPGMDEAKCSLHSATRSSGGTRPSSAIVPAVHTAVGTTTSTRSGHGHVMPSTRLDDGRRMLQDDDAMVTERLSCQTSTGTFDTYRRHARCAVAGTETGSERIGTLRR